MTQEVVKQKDRAAIRAENEAKVAAMRAEHDKMRAGLAEIKKQVEKIKADWEATLLTVGTTPEKLRAEADARGVTAFVNAVHRQYERENPTKRRRNAGAKRNAKRGLHKKGLHKKGHDKKAHKMVRTKI